MAPIIANNDNPITISTMATPGTLRRFKSKTITMIKIPTFIKP